MDGDVKVVPIMKLLKSKEWSKLDRPVCLLLPFLTIQFLQSLIKNEIHTFGSTMQFLYRNIENRSRMQPFEPALPFNMITSDHSLEIYLFPS